MILMTMYKMLASLIILKESDHFLNEEITELEVQKAIKKLKCEKACGLDRNYSRNVESGRTGCGAFSN